MIIYIVVVITIVVVIVVVVVVVKYHTQQIWKSDRSSRSKYIEKKINIEYIILYEFIIIDTHVIIKLIKNK